MKVKQFPYVGEGVDETEEKLNSFLKGVGYRNCSFEGAILGRTSDENHMGISYPQVGGLVLLQYDEKKPRRQDVIQMKQFPLATGYFEDETDKALNEFLASNYVVDLKYSSTSGLNWQKDEFLTGLVLVVYKDRKQWRK